MKKIDIIDVKSRWALSEQSSPRFKQYYAQDFVDRDFDSLTCDEKMRLITQWEEARGKYVVSEYLKGISRFKEANWNKAQVGKLHIMHSMNPNESNALMSLRDYSELPASHDTTDPRRYLIQLNNDFYASSPHPVTLGLWGKSQILIDGYFRSINFLINAPDHALLKVYEPVIV